MCDHDKALYKSVFISVLAAVILRVAFLSYPMGLSTNKSVSHNLLVPDLH